MEITIMGYLGIKEVIWGLYWDNGKENGHYHSMIGYIHYSMLSHSIIHCGTSHERAPLNLGLLVGRQVTRQVLVRVLYVVLAE